MQPKRDPCSQKKGPLAAEKGPLCSRKGTPCTPKGTICSQKGTPCSQERAPLAKRKGAPCSQKGTPCSQKGTPAAQKGPLAVELRSAISTQSSLKSCARTFPIRVFSCRFQIGPPTGLPKKQGGAATCMFSCRFQIGPPTGLQGGGGVGGRGRSSYLCVFLQIPNFLPVCFLADSKLVHQQVCQKKKRGRGRR